ncbi:hypothetical protein NEH16_20815 [Streptomyces drozdowiczii]|uniref:tRNA nuclease CdiA C-terminal domain-containing protein n=1 Tax=Streptomyces drozdowiczii TaxID=202862 RepID=A0ABY6PWV1_9ACTN|nr:hypothetical protein [Streptomyces drozdowiczii]UZK56209.1 hypothetical protein NEH16_20815 [Streptomyces drozdowiczii]
MVRLPEGVHAPEGSLRIPEGTLKLPEGTTALPENVLKGTDEAGNTVYLDRPGNVLSEDGTLLQHHSAARQEGAGARASASPEEALVGSRAGGHASDGHTSGHGPDAHTSHETLDGGHHGGPGGLDEGHSGGRGGGSDGGSGHGADGDYGPSDPAGWNRPPDDSGPFPRGGETELQIRSQLRGTRVKPGDVEKILQNLATHPAGKELADTIASGRFRDAANFSDVVSNISQYRMIPGCREQIRLANRLYDSGLTDIAFEIKRGGHEIRPGVFTAEGTDLDLMARDANGNVHGWQFKDMTNADSTPSPRKVVDKIFKERPQLSDSHADVQTFVVDTKVPRDEMVTQIDRLQRGYEGYNIQFVIRTPDGIIFVPRGGEFMPEEML